eukprot:5867742-Pleurochrysis_carterae.AAC.1
MDPASRDGGSATWHLPAAASFSCVAAFAWRGAGVSAAPRAPARPPPAAGAGVVVVVAAHPSAGAAVGAPPCSDCACLSVVLVPLPRACRAVPPSPLVPPPPA